MEGWSFVFWLQMVGSFQKYMSIMSALGKTQISLLPSFPPFSLSLQQFKDTQAALSCQAVHSAAGAVIPGQQLMHCNP